VVGQSVGIPTGTPPRGKQFGWVVGQSVGIPTGPPPQGKQIGGMKTKNFGGMETKVAEVDESGITVAKNKKKNATWSVSQCAMCRPNACVNMTR